MGAAVYGMGEGEERAHRNLGRFVKAHIVPRSPWGEGEKAETLEGNRVWWEARDGKRVVSGQSSLDRTGILTILQIMPDNITVSSVPSKVANGELWILEGVINYA